MPVHFEPAEMSARRAAACKKMADAGLDGLLIFRQESMYYLTGYDTFGYVYFQCLYLGADGRVMLLTRAPDLRQARHTSDIEDIRIWVDGHGASPADQLRDILSDFGCRGQKLGVEWDAYGLTAKNGQMLSAALEDFCALEDASALVSDLRLVKSAAEMAYVRRAAELADASLDAALETTHAGAFEGDILAAMQAAVFQGGGDDPANETIIGSGPGALLCRYFTGRRHLDAQDQLTLEFAGVYRHYHACLMRTIAIGSAPREQLAMFDAARDALAATHDALKPGRPIGEAFDAHARTLDAAGLKEHRLNACGYSLGTTYAPNWMDWPMLYHGNPVLCAPGQVFFTHMIIMNSDLGLAMTLGETVEITETGARRLSARPIEMLVK